MLVLLLLSLLLTIQRHWDVFALILTKWLTSINDCQKLDTIAIFENFSSFSQPLTSQGILPLSGLSLQVVSFNSSLHMFEISGESSWASAVSTKIEIKINFHLFVFFFYCVSRPGDGTQDLHLRQSFRTGQVDAADGGQEVQVKRTAAEPLPLCPLIPGEHRRHSTSVFRTYTTSTSHCCCVTAAVRPALEEGGAEEVPAPGSHLAVGGDAHPAHGAAGLHFHGEHHQRPQTGDRVWQSLHPRFNLDRFSI